MPFGFSTFSSFGHDKTHLGWAAGLYGGYRFNSIFSAELSAKYGEMNLSAQDCCVERNYWLGSDGMLYNAGVLGMDSWEYANLKSHVRMGRYGARVNINLLGLFHKTADSRWDLAVSPHIYAVTTKADIQTIADDAKVMKGSTNWHLGYGADLQVGVPIARVCESPNAGNSPTTNCTLLLPVVAVVSSISLVHDAITIVTTASMMY